MSISLPLQPLPSSLSQTSSFNTPDILEKALRELKDMYTKSPSYPYPYYTPLLDNSFNILAIEIQEIMEYKEKNINEQNEMYIKLVKPPADITPVIINTKNINPNTKTLDINPNFEALGLQTEKEQDGFNYERYMEDVGYQTFNVDTRLKKYLYLCVLDNQFVEISGTHLDIEEKLTSLHTLVEQDWLKSQIKSNSQSNTSDMSASKVNEARATPVKHKI